MVKILSREDLSVPSQDRESRAENARCNRTRTFILSLTGRGDGGGPARARRARFGIPILSLAIAGCARVAQPAPAPRPVMVSIPVATPIYCQVPSLQPPPLAIAMLTPDSPPADTIRYYVASVDVLKSAVQERDTILKGCGAPEEANIRPLGNAEQSRAKGNPNSGMSLDVAPASTSLRGPSAPQTSLGMTQKTNSESSKPATPNSSTIAGALLGRLRGMVPW